MAIGAIFVSMTCVGFRDSWSSLRTQSLQYALRQSVLSVSLLARERGHFMLMCGIPSDQQRCSADWSRGWLVIDMQTQTEIERHDLSGRFTLKWAGGLGEPVRFRPDGRPDGIQGGWRCRLNGRELFHEVLLRVI